MARTDGRDFYLPEGTDLCELVPQHKGWSKIGQPWLNWARAVTRLLKRINFTGEQNGVVVTDDTGTATVSGNRMEDVVYNAADFTASAGTWTVGAGDVVNYSRVRLGRMLTIAFHFQATSVSATPVELRVAVPGGFVSQRPTSTLCYLSDNGTAAVGEVTVSDSGTYLAFTRLDGANFAAAADATTVRGEIVMEVE